MNERNTQMNSIADRCQTRTADFVYLRSSGFTPSYIGWAYTSWLFTDGRSYRS